MRCLARVLQRQMKTKRGGYFDVFDDSTDVVEIRSCLLIEDYTQNQTQTKLMLCVVTSSKW